MKKFSVSLAMLVLILVLGLAFVGCKTEPDVSPFEGTWAWSNNQLRYIFIGNEFTCVWNFLIILVNSAHVFL